MTSYVVLARKWRPAQFSDIVGQSHIVRTLMNAIRAERIHQAYLFTGSRGIGKTSIARIFAKAIRCPNAQWDSTKEELRSCDECPSCKEIAAGTSVDVMEIDGASNNGVDAVREIRESAKYLPASGSRKIYIIDEVHMLTTAAFNALLKTLEEPPPHVIFIFATTEPHKIPMTILSRCQRFDFRRVTVAQAQARLTQVAEAEQIHSEPGSLALIARAAEGSMRDALSLLDQVIAFSGSEVTVASVRESVGLIAGQAILELLKAIAERSPLEALKVVERAYEQGHDLKVLVRHLIEFLHAAILAQVGAPRPSHLELSEDEWNEISGFSRMRPLEEWEIIFQALHQGADWVSRSPQPKLVLDVLLIKCSTAEVLVEVSGSSSSSSAPSGKSPLKKNSPPPTPSSSVTQASEPKEPPRSQNVSPEPAPAVKTPTQNAVASAAMGPRSWEGSIEHVRKTRPLLASILEHGLCIDFPQSEEADTLEVCFRSADHYFKEQLQSRIYQEQLQTLTREYLGRFLRIAVQTRDAGETVAEKREREVKQQEESAKDAVLNHPIISEARSLFGAEIGPIEWIDPKTGESHAIQ